MTAALVAPALRLLALVLACAAAKASADGPSTLDPELFDPSGFGVKETLSARRIVLCSGFDEFGVGRIERFLQAGLVPGPPITVVSRGDAEPAAGPTVWFLIDDEDLSPEVRACAARAGDLRSEVVGALADWTLATDGPALAAHLEAQGIDPNLMYQFSRYFYAADDAAIVTITALRGDDLAESALELLFGLRPGACELLEACAPR